MHHSNKKKKKEYPVFIVCEIPEPVENTALGAVCCEKRWQCDPVPLNKVRKYNCLLLFISHCIMDFLEFYECGRL